MKRLLVLAALLVSSFVAQAAAPSPESIDALLDLTQADKMLDSAKGQVGNSIKASMAMALKGEKPTAKQQKVLDAYADKAAAIVNKSISMARMRPLYVKLYTQHFTQEDVDAMIAFYKTPAGKAMITKMPQLIQGLMAEMPAFMAPVMDQIQAAAMQLEKDLQKAK